MIGIRGKTASSQNTTAPVLNVPSGTVAGDVMLAFLSLQSQTITVTAPAGWTLLSNCTVNSAGTFLRAYTYYRVAGASEPASYTWTFSANVVVWADLISFSGVDNTNPIFGSSSNGGSSSTLTAPAIVGAPANAQLVFHVGVAAGTVTGPAGWPVEATVNSDDFCYSFIQFAAGDTVTPTALCSALSDYIAQFVVLNPATTKIKLRASNSDPTTTAAQTKTVAVPSGTVDGDLMLAFVTVNIGGATFTPPAGWTLARGPDSNTGGLTTAVYWRIASSEPASYTWTTTTVRTWSTGMLSLYGHDPANPIDTSGFTGINTSSSLTIPSMTTTVDGCALILTLNNASTASDRATGPAGFNSLQMPTVGNVRFHCATQVTKGVAPTPTWTSNSSLIWSVEYIAVNPLTSVAWTAFLAGSDASSGVGQPRLNIASAAKGGTDASSGVAKSAVTFHPSAVGADVSSGLARAGLVIAAALKNGSDASVGLATGYVGMRGFLIGSDASSGLAVGGISTIAFAQGANVSLGMAVFQALLHAASVGSDSASGDLAATVAPPPVYLRGADVSGGLSTARLIFGPRLSGLDSSSGLISVRYLAFSRLTGSDVSSGLLKPALKSNIYLHGSDTASGMVVAGVITIVYSLRSDTIDLDLILLDAINGQVLARLDTAKVDSVMWALNDTGQIDYVLPKNDPRAPLIHSYLTEVQLWYQGSPLWWGVNSKRKSKPNTGQSSGSVAWTAYGLLQYFKHRYVTRASLLYTSLEQINIAINLAFAAQSGEANMNLNIPAGNSTPSGRVRSRNYDRAQHENYFDLLAAFTKLNGGFDMSVEIDPAGQSRQIMFWYPKKGVDTGIVMEWGRNMVDYEEDEDGTALANEVWATGGTANGVKFENNYQDVAAATKYRVMQKIIADSQQQDVAWLLDDAKRYTSVYKNPTIIDKVTVKDSALQPLIGQISPGDTALVVIDDNEVQVSTPVRVAKMTWRPPGSTKSPSATVDFEFTQPIVYIS